jgi:hypothetical protein
VPSGKPIETCGAYVKKRGKPCGLPKGHGTNHPGSGHCKWHFGNTETGKENAAKEAGLSLLKYTDPVSLDPTSALLQELHRTAGMVAYLDQQAAKWEVDTDKEIPDHQRQWMRVHMVERKHLVEVSKTAIAAGIAERQVQLAEQQGAILAMAIEGILDGLSLSADQIALVPVLVPQILRQVAHRVDQPLEITG